LYLPKLPQRHFNGMRETFPAKLLIRRSVARPINAGK
jgi:hypothetical protein